MTPRQTQAGGIVLWLSAGLVLLSVVIIGGIAGYWLFLNLWFGMAIKEQPLALGLPKQLDVTTEVTNILDIQMAGDIRAQVPFDKAVSVPLRGEYDIDVKLDVDVPVEFEVLYDGVIPVDTEATIQARTTLNFKTIKQYRGLKIKTTLPLKFDLPVRLEVPVKDTIAFDYEGPIKAVLNQNLDTRVDTVLDTRLPVNQTVSAPVTREFGLRLFLPDDPVRARIDYADLNIDLSSLRLEIADDTDGPERLPSPYGPAAR